MEETQTHSIGIIGGTGKEGKGLAFRWARAGHSVCIGSRNVDKALQAAEEVNLLLGKRGWVTGKTNSEAVRQAEIVVLTVPFAVHRDMLNAVKDEVAGKIFIDVTVPLVPPRVTRVQMPPAGSAAQEAQELLGPSGRVVAAFQNISYEHLLHGDEVDCDVLVCGSDQPAKEVVLSLVHSAGLVGWDAGPLENAVVVEGLTSILIGINKKMKVNSAGIRITGVPGR